MNASGRRMPSMNSAIWCVSGSSTRKFEVGLVARGDAVGEAQAPIGAGAQPELQCAAGLEDGADRAGREAAELGVGIGEHTLVIAVRAHAVGAGNAHLAALEKILEPSATLLRFRIVAVAHGGGVDRGRRHTRRIGVFQHARDRWRRHDHHRMIDTFGQLAQ
jgi:hypothetical protein